MKRFTKVCLTLSGVCAGIGVILIIIGFAMGASMAQSKSWGSNLGNTVLGWLSWDEEDVDSFKEYVNSSEDIWNGEEQVYTYTGEKLAGIRSLDIEMQTGSLKIMETDVEEIRLVVESDGGRVECETSDGVLSIQDKSSSFQIFGFSIGDFGEDAMTVELYLPKNKVFEEFDVEVKAGEIVSEELMIATKDAKLNVDVGSLCMNNLTVENHLKVEVGAGEVELGGLSTDTMQLDCGVGEMNVTGMATGDITAECGTGELELTMEDEMEQFNYLLECGIGEIKIGNESYSSIGNKREIDNKADKDMNLDCGIGEIQVDFK